MISRFTEQEYKTAKKTDLLHCECEECHQLFTKPKITIYNVLNNPKWATFAKFCSQKCFQNHKKRNKTIVKCEVCGKEIIRNPAQISASTRYFCSAQCFHLNPKIKRPHTCLYCGIEYFPKSKKLSTRKEFCSKNCSGKYHAIHKKHGGSRSKLEIWIELQLPNIYPDLVILYNDRKTIKAELDIYIPSLALAFELNGIFHYEPIIGQALLDKIQNHDQRKFQACLEHNIELCIIDNREIKKFKVEQGQKYLDIITNIINSKIIVA